MSDPLTITIETSDWLQEILEKNFHNSKSVVVAKASASSPNKLQICFEIPHMVKLGELSYKNTSNTNRLFLSQKKPYNIWLITSFKYWFKWILNQASNGQVMGFFHVTDFCWNSNLDRLKGIEPAIKEAKGDLEGLDWLRCIEEVSR